MTVKEFVDHIGEPTRLNFFDSKSKLYLCSLPSDSPMIDMFSGKLIDTFGIVVITPLGDEPYQTSFSLFVIR